MPALKAGMRLAPLRRFGSYSGREAIVQSIVANVLAKPALALKPWRRRLPRAEREAASRKRQEAWR
jgi:hypothetical protein